MLTLLNVWKAYKNSGSTPGWCRSQFLLPRHLQFAAEVRKQLRSVCQNAGVAIESTHDLEIVRQAIGRGLFMNIAQLALEGHYVSLDSGQHVHIHPSSVLFRWDNFVFTLWNSQKLFYKLSLNRSLIYGILNFGSKKGANKNVMSCFIDHNLILG